MTKRQRSAPHVDKYGSIPRTQKHISAKHARAPVAEGGGITKPTKPKLTQEDVAFFLGRPVIGSEDFVAQVQAGGETTHTFTHEGRLILPVALQGNGEGVRMATAQRCLTHIQSQVPIANDSVGIPVGGTYTQRLDRKDEHWKVAVSVSSPVNKALEPISEERAIASAMYGSDAIISSTPVLVLAVTTDFDSTKQFEYLATTQGMENSVIELGPLTVYNTLH